MSPLEVSCKPKRTSAYFSFCKHYREEVKSRLKEAGQPISAPSLTKALSELWRSLPESKKQKYKDPSYFCPNILSKLSSGGDGEISRDQASKAAPEEFEAITEAMKNGEGESEMKEFASLPTEEEGTQDGSPTRTGNIRVLEDVKHGGCTENGGLAFPLARIKRIIKLDKEIRVVASDASNLIAHASQLFLEHLAAAAHAEALKKKHKTIRLEDVKMAIRSEPRVNDFLAEALNDALHLHKENDLEDTDDEDEYPEHLEKSHANKKSQSVKKPLLEAPAGNRRIADFFGSNTNTLQLSH